MMSIWLHIQMTYFLPKSKYHVSCRANYCSKTKISEQQQVAIVENESTSAPRSLSRADTTSFKIRRDCFICGKASSRPEPLIAISTSTGASTRDKVLRAASERLDEDVLYLPSITLRIVHHLHIYDTTCTACCRTGTAPYSCDSRPCYL